MNTDNEIPNRDSLIEEILANENFCIEFGYYRELLERMGDDELFILHNEPNRLASLPKFFKQSNLTPFQFGFKNFPEFQRTFPNLILGNIDEEFQRGLMNQKPGVIMGINDYYTNLANNKKRDLEQIVNYPEITPREFIGTEGYQFESTEDLIHIFPSLNDILSEQDIEDLMDLPFIEIINLVNRKSIILYQRKRKSSTTELAVLDGSEIDDLET